MLTRLVSNGALRWAKRHLPSNALRSPAQEASAIRESGLFDIVWYLERNPDAASFQDPIAHYLATGAAQQRAPHPLFDVAWYQATVPNLNGLTPLGHFILEGEAAGASPNPLFDPGWYARQAGGRKTRKDGLFRHFLQQGAKRGLSPHPAFDPAWYRSACPDIANSDTNPLTHFIGAGAGMGIAPNPFFDLRWYAGCYKDVAATKLNPLVHFLRFGAAHGHRPHPNVDLDAYRASHPDSPQDPLRAYFHLLSHETPTTYFVPKAGLDWPLVQTRLTQAGLFDPDIYRSVNLDLAAITADLSEHFARVGIHEGRPFTNSTVVARAQAKLAPTIATAQTHYRTRAEQALAAGMQDPAIQWFRAKNPSIGVFCNTEGNFYMQEIADLLAAGLRSLGLRAASRDQTAPRDEAFDLRVFVAPHEFFYLGQGLAWQDAAGEPNTVLYNVEQMQTQWFCRAFKLLLTAPLIIDINFQSARIMRHLGCQTAHFLPGHLQDSAYTTPIEDVSDITLARGYSWARRRYNWMEKDVLEDRPIDILFVGASSPRRDKTLESLLNLSDDHRFLCIYKSTEAPLTTRNQKASSGRINCALAQRSKIVLNIYRDWLGYFDWSRMIQQGLWQGACVVSDPCLPHPIYQPGVHFQQESTRHLGELIRWLLDTKDGQETLETTRKSGSAQARQLGSMQVALAPVLDAFQQLLQR